MRDTAQAINQLGVPRASRVSLQNGSSRSWLRARSPSAPARASALWRSRNLNRGESDPFQSRPERAAAPGAQLAAPIVVRNVALDGSSRCLGPRRAEAGPPRPVAGFGRGPVTAPVFEFEPVRSLIVCDRASGVGATVDQVPVPASRAPRWDKRCSRGHFCESSPCGGAARRRRRVRTTGIRFAAAPRSGPGSRSPAVGVESVWAWTGAPVSFPVPAHKPQSKIPRLPVPAHP